MKTFRQIIRYDETLGHTYVPNQFARLRYGNDGYFIETDQWGFRNSPTELTGRKKIIVLGDSYTAGDGVSNSERFSDILQRDLNCKVTNLGVSGYGADQQLLAYEKFQDQIEHDIVIFAPHLDDLNRNLMQAREGIDKSSGHSALIPKPYFTLKNGALVLQNVPVPIEREHVESTSNIQPENSLFSRGKNYLRRRVLKQELHPELSNGKSSEWILMHAIIERLLKIAKGKQVLLAPLPYYDSVTYKEQPFYLKEFERHKSANVHLVDLATPLNAEHSLENDTLFSPICGHYSPNGHALVAANLSELLQKESGLERRANEISGKKKPEKPVFVLGISCFYHDSSAALLKDGQVIAAAQEERFSRIKHDKAFPSGAINYCLEEGRIGINDLQAIVYYDYETWTIERVMHNSLALELKGDAFWDQAKKSLYSKLKLPLIIREKINYQGAIYKTQHHVSHAAGAFFPSPFDEAAILVIDGVGEWACSTIASGEGNKLKILKQQYYPHSLGLLYSAFTYFCGFKVNSGEYKLMGLAPYGTPKYADRIKEHVVDIREDGSLFLNMDYFSFMEGDRMTNDTFADLFDGPARTGESEITRREMDLAASIQAVTEEIVVKMANHAYQLTGKKNLVMSGGVALNCVSNGKLYDQTPFEDFYFQPASGDAGGAVGCAMNWYYENYPEAKKISQANAYLGPEIHADETEAFLSTKGLTYHSFQSEKRAEFLADLLVNKNVIGYFDGRMEFGPRALGNRSIIANPMDVDMQSKLNLKIKFRESFRPFAPIYAEERTCDYFDFDRPSPYMLVVRNVKESLLVQQDQALSASDNMIEIVNQKRSVLPAITHVDNSARLQSVNDSQNKRMHDLLLEFEKRTGKAVLINTSFNVRGEPIVCSLNDAYKCFMRTNMDILVLNDYYLVKSEQPNWQELENWQETFELD